MQSAFNSMFQYQRPRYASKLNLVALMDIFTILVFFLLLNTGEAEKIQNTKVVQLPDAHAGTQPHGDLVVMIGQDAIWLGEQRIISLEEVTQSAEYSIPALSEALAAYRERRGELNRYEEENGLPLTIMGDRAVSFSLLKTVMATCRLENFRNIALAVNQVGAPAPPTAEEDAAPALAERSP